MTHLSLIVGALLSAGLGIYIIIATKVASTPALVLGVFLVLLALWFMLQAKMEAAGAMCVKLWQAYKNPNGGANAPQ